MFSNLCLYSTLLSCLLQTSQAEESITQPTTKKLEHQAQPTLELRSHKFENLENFAIPELKLESKNLKQALLQLEESYQEICKQTGEIPLKLHFKGSIDSERKISFHFKHYHLKSIVGALASIYHQELSLDNDLNQFNFSPIAKGDDKAVDRLINVQPNWFERFHQNPKLASTSVRQILQLMKPVSYHNPTSTLKVTTTKAETKILSSFLKNGYSQTMIYVKSTLISTSLKAKINLNEPHHIFMKKQVSLEGAKVNNLPNCLIRDAETLNIEVIQDHQDENQWTGIKYNLTAQKLGFSILINYDFNTKDKPNSKKHTTRSRNLNRSQASFTVKLNNDGSKNTYLRTSVSLIGPTGKKVPFFLATK